MNVDIERFQGGRKWLLGGGLGGALLLALTFLGALGDAPQAMHSYLVAFAYWCGIGLVSLILLMIFHAMRVRWMVVLRRPLEAMASSAGLFLLLFIPIALGMKHLYIWVDPPATLGKEALHLLHHKHAYLNVTAFVVRTVVYFGLFGLIAHLLWRWSTRQDVSGAIEQTERSRALGAGGLPFVAFGFTFAAFDWLMSLHPLWFSTIFGVYVFAGAMVSTISLLAIVTNAARGRGLFGSYVSTEHIHSLGKLMLAFTCFWGYIGFSQFMLIWVANLPEETPFYILRMNKGWAWVGIFLIFGHFVIPFGALLSRSLKRDRRKLAVVAVWILLVHYIDLFWLVMPALRPEGFALHWTSITSFFGVGLVAVAFTVWRLRGQFTVPVKDPYLAESLRYKQP